MADDIILNKLEIIEKCIKRIHEEYTPDSLRNHQTKQDSVLLNLERACQAAIDMGMRVCRLKRLGIPKESRDPFALMHEHKFISEDLQNKMFGLVGFRNTAVHNYKKLDLNIVEVIIKKHLVDFQEFGKICIKIT
jgi:uncharacterized protein YutE (UPF0331/DUF86 family)